jgi:hypothetical protein
MVVVVVTHCRLIGFEAEDSENVEKLHHVKAVLEEVVKLQI